MAEVIRMPRLSDTMEEGVIVDWFKKKGDKVSAGDVLAEVETDKATMELESYQEGILLYIGVEKGDAVPVDGILAIIGKKDEDYKALLKEEEGKQKEAKDESADKEPESKEEPEEEAEKEEETEKTSSSSAKDTSSASASTSDDSRLKASPLARKMAEEKGIDISTVSGSGDEGRIVKRDIENYKPSEAAKSATAAPVKLPEVVSEEGYEEVKVSQMRKTIAKRLAESKYTAPHFYLTMEIEMDRCIAAREAINAYAPVKISFNDIIVKASAAALRKHPAVNSSWQGDTMRQYKHIHIGVAVAVEEGLVVPVVRFADNKSLSHIATEVKQLAEKARNKKIQPDDMTDNTFSISNLGMFGIDEFTAIINPPNSCILAVGGISKKLVLEDDMVAERSVMKVTLSCDHRVVDGATGAQFLQTFKALLEDPVRMLV